MSDVTKESAMQEALEKMRSEKYPIDRHEMTSQCDVFAFILKKHGIGIAQASKETKILAQAVSIAWEMYKQEFSQ